MRTEEAARVRQVRCPYCNLVSLWELDRADDKRQWFSACPECGERRDIRYNPTNDQVTALKV